MGQANSYHLLYVLSLHSNRITIRNPTRRRPGVTTIYSPKSETICRNGDSPISLCFSDAVKVKSTAQVTNGCCKTNRSEHDRSRRKQVREIGTRASLLIARLARRNEPGKS